LGSFFYSYFFSFLSDSLRYKRIKRRTKKKNKKEKRLIEKTALETERNLCQLNRHPPSSYFPFGLFFEEKERPREDQNQLVGGGGPSKPKSL